MTRHRTLALLYSGTDSVRWSRAARNAAPGKPSDGCRRQWREKVAAIACSTTDGKGNHSR
jgi:hypothetical protein